MWSEGPAFARTSFLVHGARAREIGQGESQRSFRNRRLTARLCCNEPRPILPSEFPSNGKAAARSVGLARSISSSLSNRLHHIVGADRRSAACAPKSV